MGAYQEAVAALRKLEEGVFRDREAYLNHIDGLSTTLEKVAEGFSKTGYGKMAQGVITIRNRMIALFRRLESGKLSSVSEVKEIAGESLKTLMSYNPKTADTKADKAGIKDHSRAFEGFNKKRVRLEIGDQESFKLERAPMLLMFKNRITPTQTRVLRELQATFYQGTNGVSLPAIPILVLNRNLVSERDYDKKIKQILKGLKRPDLAVFTSEGVVKRNCIAFPVFEPRIAELMAVGIFDQVAYKELWIN